MSIGETLAEARRRASLTTTQVSRLTRIRETLVRDIERDDYSACGADFYARGHIRAIARVVGIDPEPLIGEYDAVRRPATPTTAADLLRPATSIEPHQPRRRRNWAVLLALAVVIVLGVTGYNVIASTHHTPGATRPGGARTGTTTRQAGTPAPTPAPAAAPYAHSVVIHVTAVADCWVGFTSPAGGSLFQAYVFGGTSKTWIFQHSVDMRLGNPGGIVLTVDGTHPLPPGTVNPITLSLGLNRKITTAP
jgi:transcriptional regulator with XRE-family HTH domain